MTSAMSIDDLDFAAIIKSGDVVVCGQAASEPRTLTEALVIQKDRLPSFRTVVGPLLAGTFAPEKLRPGCRPPGVIAEINPDAPW